jgi:glycerol-3-phosphate acyltransferase PlsY
MNSLFLYMAGGMVAYLLGSIPFGFLIAKTQGVDIRTVGSGNIGATNVFRSISKKLGILTFLLDAAKGFCGAWLIPLLAALLFPHAADVAEGKAFALVCGALTIAGHNWTCFLGFKGGKGIATSVGLLVGLSQGTVLIAALIWILFFVTTRYVSVASIAAAITLGVVAWPLHARDPWWFPAMLTLLALVAIWKHRSNIARLRAGTESRFNFGKKK